MLTKKESRFFFNVN